MKVVLMAGHVGSNGLNPPGDHGGGEAATFGILRQLMDHYDTTLAVANGVYPGIDKAVDYGYDVANAKWRNFGPSLDWMSAYDAMISINHHQLFPPIARMNLLYSFFPQFPGWDVSGYQYILADSHYAAHWIKRYWGVEAEVLYPPINLLDLNSQIFANSEKKPNASNIFKKKKRIVAVGRFFNVPGGNNKRHDVLIKAFKSMFQADWELVLVGAVLDKKYYDKVRSLAGDDPRIKFAHNLDRDGYRELMQSASFVWSATGYEADKPSGVEHFGIFTLEGQATGAIVLAHNSGGPKEMGAVTWDEPDELIAKTLELIGDPKEYAKQQQAGLKLAAKYMHQAHSDTIIKYLEQPDLFPPSEKRKKTYFSQPQPDNIKVAMMSDSPRRTYGFSVPVKMIGQGLKKLGYDVVHFGMQDPWIGQPDDIDYGVIYDYLEGVSPDMNVVGMEHLKKAVDQANWEHLRVWRGWDSDPNGYSALGRFLEQEKPDVLYMQYDIGNVRTWLDALRAKGSNTPIVAHLPIEGSPIIDQFIETLRLVKVMNGTPLLYTEWGAQKVKEQGGPDCPWVWLGADHADFKPLDPERREELRKAVGWEDKIVIFNGGRNRRTKGGPQMLEAMKMLIADYPNAILYWHTSSQDRIANSSFPLRDMIKIYDLQDHIVLPDDLGDQGAGVDYEVGREVEIEDTDDMNEVYRANLSSLSLNERMGIADIYLNLSEVEGFNLWLPQAMGMGLPIVSVNDLGVQREVLGDAAEYVPVFHWDTWHTGAMLAQVRPADAYLALKRVIENEELKACLVEKSLARYPYFKWNQVVDKIHEIIRDRMGV